MAVLLNHPAKPVVTIVITGFLLSVSAICPPNWQEIGPSCYFFAGQETFWEVAQSYCRQRGGQMLGIESPEENTVISEEVVRRGQPRVWIGCSDVRKEGSWECNTAEPGPMRFERWSRHHNQPNGGESQSCAALNADLQEWFDDPCDATWVFTVCETASNLVSCQILGEDGRLHP